MAASKLPPGGRRRPLELPGAGAGPKPVRSCPQTPAPPRRTHAPSHHSAARTLAGSVLPSASAQALSPLAAHPPPEIYE